MLLPGALAGLIWLFRDFEAIAAAARDPYMRIAVGDFLAFRRHYRTDYLGNSLGGTFRPSVVDVSLSPRLVREVFDVARIVASCDFEAVIGFGRGLVELSYRSGFQCWWVPALLLAEDFARWSNPTEGNATVDTTPDGLLGALFPGHGDNIMKMVRERAEISKQDLSRSVQETRRQRLSRIEKE